MSSFSKRNNLVKTPEIKVYNDAPEGLRYMLVTSAYKCEVRPSSLRDIICETLLKRPDPSNWSEYPNIDGENHSLIDNCEWYKVYDVIEVICGHLSKYRSAETYDRYAKAINDYFIELGIGWQIKDRLVESRGEEGYERILQEAQNTLSKTNKDRAANELHEAIHDISRRPEPDITGAIQHAMAALECVLREICGDTNPTLGAILKKHKELIPKPLDTAVEKAWGYSSEMARHIKEGREPSHEEAELVVGISASLINYLLRKDTQHNEYLSF